MFDPKKINLDLDNLDNFDLNKKETKEDTEDQTKNIKKETIIIKSENLPKKEKNNLNKKDEKKEGKIIFDININSLQDLLKYLIIEKYDFFTIEPTENKVKIGFKKNNVEKNVKYITYPIYLNILLEAKKIGKLKLEETKKTQENKTSIILKQKNYDFLIKSVPDNAGEKLFIKLKETEKKLNKKRKEKVSMSKLLYILAGMLFIAILLGGIFMTIVIFNSNSVADLQFFNNLGVNTDAIKDFAASLVNAFFGFTLLTEIILLFIFAYKAFLTKKEFKQKKVSRIIISIFFLILTAITFITWIFLSNKINELKGLNYGKIEYYDNTKFNSQLFNQKDSIIDITENIIGPITIRFDNSEFIKKLIDDGFKPKTVVWEIDGERKEKGINDSFFIYEFKEKGLHKVQLIVKGSNIKGEIDEKVKEIGNININNIVTITEKKLDNSGKKFSFDASDLSYLGKIYWYYIPSLKGKTDEEINRIVSKALSKEERISYTFNSKNIFNSEEYYAIKIISGDKSKDEIKEIPLSRIFIVGVSNDNDITGEIEAIKNIEYPKKYSFKIKNPKSKFGGAYITQILWKIEDINTQGKKVISPFKKDINLAHIEDSSKINYTFKTSGEHKVFLQIIDSENNIYDINPITININKNLKLKNQLVFNSKSQILKKKKDIIFEEANDIYYIENILSPSSLEIDASKIRAINSRYGLNKVSWDINNDGNFSLIENKIKYDVNTSGIHTLKVKYEFLNKLNLKDKIEKTQIISISSLDKDALLNLRIIMENSYVPTIVKFDASKSKVTGKNIDKFVFDYGDGTKPEARDAINSGHKYNKAGDYKIKLTVVTDDGIKYSIVKKLILKDREQRAMIKTSLNRAPAFQSIDFSAEDSIGEVAKYFWDFGDDEISMQANPTHFYKKPGKYKVNLKLEFTNKNTLEKEKIIEIYEN